MIFIKIKPSVWFAIAGAVQNWLLKNLLTSDIRMLLFWKSIWRESTHNHCRNLKDGRLIANSGSLWVFCLLSSFWDIFLFPQSFWLSPSYFASDWYSHQSSTAVIWGWGLPCCRGTEGRIHPESKHPTPSIFNPLSRASGLFCPLSACTDADYKAKVQTYKGF